MERRDIEGGGDDDIRAQAQNKYRPVSANDRAVLEMSSMDSGPPSISNQFHSAKYVFLSWLCLCNLISEKFSYF